MTVYLTHGAKKNVGDYLIHSRARKLWKHVRPDLTVKSIARWEPNPGFKNIELTVLCGGPGLTSNFADVTFPIVESASKSGSQISGLALGWSGQPWKKPMAFRMSPSNLKLLNRIIDESGPISVRDNLTKRIADNLGIKSVMTGCTAWYSLEHLGRQADTEKREPESIVFTTAAHRRNTLESIRVMRLLKEKFPKARIYASFHRGIHSDDETSLPMAAPLIFQSRAAQLLGIEVVDTAYSLEKIEFYKDVDLHVGYRVHAHLDFVSRRKPSLLIAEDGRGIGQIQTLHDKGIQLVAGTSKFLKLLDEKLTFQVRAGWPSLDQAIATIDSTYPLMVQAIKQQSKNV